MKRLMILLVIILVAGCTLRAGNERADEFTMEQDALDRAAELGCGGATKHTLDTGNNITKQIVWTPCSSLEEWKDITGLEKEFKNEI